MKSNSIFNKLSDEELLALCIDREARGEPEDGKVAVGSVVLNRVAWGKRFPVWGKLYGNSIKSVILAPAQFSWTIENPLEPNYLGAVEIAKNFQRALNDPKIGKSLAECLRIATGLLSGEIKRNTVAMYYHEQSIRPKWAKEKTELIRIGNHIFYA